MKKATYPKHVRMLHTFRYTCFLLIIFLFSPLSAFGQESSFDIRKQFQMLEDSYASYQNWHERLQHDMSDSVWFATQKEISKIHNQKYAENNRIISGIRKHFKQGEAAPKADYDTLYECTKDAFNLNNLDNFLLEEFFEMIQPYYKAANDTTRTIQLDFMLGICKAEISRLGDKESGMQAKECFYRNIMKSDDFPTLEVAAQMCIPISFINYAYTLSALGFVSPSEAYDAKCRLEKFTENYKSIIPERTLNRCYQYLNVIKRTSVFIHAGSKYETPADTLAFLNMIDESPFDEDQQPELKTVSDSLDYYITCKLSYRMKPHEFLVKARPLLMKLFDEVEQQDTIKVRDIQNLSNIFGSVLSIMEEDSLTVKTQEDTLYVVSLGKRYVPLVQRTYIKGDPFFFESIVGRMACSKDLVKYLSPADKLAYMSELAVKTQFATVVHVTSVKNLSTVILDALLDSCPKEFLGIRGYNTVKKLRNNRSLLIAWIASAAEFHDLGKNSMSPIISNEFRSLTDHEFNLIRKHPEMSLSYLETDSIFMQFKDVALGHHKWYNGKGGYPASFDNTTSPWRPFIDLVTIADCIDAATDNASRSYAKPKPLIELLEEFKKEAGTRYNPVMINAIIADKKLCHKIERIITVEREKCNNGVRHRFIK